MPKNKNAYLRYRVIDNCLNNTMRNYSKEDLRREIFNKTDIKISLEMLTKDIHAMRNELGAPIDYNKSIKAYKYEFPFSLKDIDIDDEELLLIELSLSTLSLFKGTSYLNDFEQLIDKLDISQRLDVAASKFVQLEVPNGDAGTVYIDDLIAAIKEKNVLDISYCPYLKEVRTYTVSPYVLKEFRNRWYLVAFDNVNDRIMTLPLDRIKKLSLNFVHPYKKDPNFKTQEYFKHSFGITRLKNEPPLELLLKFNKVNIGYILSQPLHSTQSIKEKSEDFLVVSINVYDSPELTMQILSYGDGVEVLAPQSYRDFIANEIKKVFKLYK